MVYPPTREPQARVNIFELKIGHLLNNAREGDHLLEDPERH